MEDFWLDTRTFTRATSTIPKTTSGRSMSRFLEAQKLTILVLVIITYTEQGHQRLRKLIKDYWFQFKEIPLSIHTFWKNSSTSKSLIPLKLEMYYWPLIDMNTFCLNDLSIKMIQSYIFLSFIAFLESLTLAKYSAPKALIIDLDTDGRYWIAVSYTHLTLPTILLV